MEEEWSGGCGVAVVGYEAGEGEYDEEGRRVRLPVKVEEDVVVT